MRLSATNGSVPYGGAARGYLTVMVSGTVADVPPLVAAWIMMVVVVVWPEEPEQPATSVAIVMSAQAAKTTGARWLREPLLRELGRRALSRNRTANAHRETTAAMAALLDRLKPVLLPLPRIASIGRDRRRELFAALSVTERFVLAGPPSGVTEPGAKSQATPVGRFEHENRTC